MGEITRNHERKQTSGMLRSLAVALSVAAFSGGFLTPKGLKAEEPKPRPAVITVAKGPTSPVESVEGTKRMQGQECSTATTMEDLQRFDEETTARGYRDDVSVINEGKYVTGKMTNGRQFSAMILPRSAALALMVSKNGTDGVGKNNDAIEIPLSELNERANEFRFVVEDRALDKMGGYFQVYAVPVDSLGAKPDYRRESLPFILVGLDLRTDELYVSKGTICRGTSVSFVPLK